MDAIAAKARHRPRRGAAAQSDRDRRDALCTGRSKRSAPKSCSIPATTPGCSTRRWQRIGWPALQGETQAPPRRGRSGRRRARPCSSRRAASVRSTACKIAVDIDRRRRGRHRRGLGRAGRRDGDRADLRRCARRRLPSACGSCTARPTASTTAWAPSPRASTVMTGEATRLAALKVRAKALEMAAELLQSAAGRPRHRRRRDRAQVAASSAAFDLAWRDARASARRLRSTRGDRDAGAGRRRLVPHRPHELPLWRACRRRAGRPRDRRGRRSSATSSPMTSAARSIRCWSKARSPAASRKGLGGALFEEFHLRRARRAAVASLSPTT